MEKPSMTHVPASPLSPPMAEKRHHIVEICDHGARVEDNYFYLRNRDDETVLAHIDAENAYTEYVLAPTVPLQQKLFDEMKQYVQDEDSTYPTPKSGYLYYERSDAGEEYVKHCRRRQARNGEETVEEILLDCVRLAEDADFLEVGFIEVSPSSVLLAYATDFSGDERFELKIKDLSTGNLLEDSITDVMVSDVEGGVCWSNDSQCLYYVKQDGSARPYQLFRHRIGTKQEEDELLFHEKDDRFRLKVYKTQSERFAILSVAETVAYDIFLIDINNPKATLRQIHSRESVGVIVAHVEHHGESLLFLHNAQGAENFKLSSCPLTDTKLSEWRDVISHKPDIYLTDLHIFKDFLVLHERFGGSPRIRICKVLSSSSSASFPAVESIHLITGRESAFHLTGGSNWEFDTKAYRYQYETFNTPPILFEVDMESGKEAILHKKGTSDSFRSEEYVVERLWALSRDGLKIPLSVVYKKDLFQRGKPARCLLYGYGAYGDCRDPWWDPSRVPMYNRGVVYVFAHVRGGGEMGFAWRENGKLMQKMNTFNDFIDSAEYLIREKWTSPDLLAINGISAGGLLVAAVTNMAPQLFRAVVADVPFTDAILTMLDDTIPLTACEWSEWGNPKIEAQFKYMMQWSPCDTIRSDCVYPAILATSGMSDSRVQYWEPLKWIAKLREKVKPNPDRPILLQTEMEGHSGPSGRFEFLRAEAFEMAFILHALGVKE